MIEQTYYIFDDLSTNKKIKPDVLFIEENFRIEEIKDTFVISRDIYGNVLSLIRDDIWDFSTYAVISSHQNKINFQTIKLEDRQTAKHIILILLVNGIGNNGSQLAVSTLYEYFSSVIKQLSRFSTENNKELKEILKSEKLILKYLYNNRKNTLKLRFLVSLLKYICKNYNIIHNIECIFTKQIEEFVKFTRIKNDENSKQTLLIPSRIYLYMIKKRQKHINTIYQYIEPLCSFFEHFLINRAFASSRFMLTKYNLSRNQHVKWNDAVSKFKLSELFNFYDVKNRKDFAQFLNLIYSTCVHQLITYSGMRRNEVLSLNNNCLKTSISDSRTVLKLLGKTTKLTPSFEETFWITSSQSEIIVNLLNKLNQIICEIYEVDYETFPLFPKSAFFKPIDEKKVITNSSLLMRDANVKKELPLDISQITITLEDKEELEKLNPLITLESIVIGEVWDFSYHQYRRSLVVYALQSGIVSIGGLQQQMKHLFVNMTMYYGNNSHNAQNLFKPDKVLSKEYQETKTELQTLYYIRDELFSEEELYGGHGKHIEMHLKNNNKEDFLPFFKKNRKNLMKRFKSGEMIYKETALGACVSPVHCDYRLVHSIYACANCSGAIIKKEKIDNLIIQQKKSIEYLYKNNYADTVEYRTEIADLEELKKYRKKLINK
ncbi:hypothetical protein [Aliarcobacter butzleri]|uniref:hypothetical protein n=1 Tax=Aliarcobacter butzleri TaxID=28197 RepID=UPI0021B1A496|nr:hypothetical protein [Aliarcobacter butzleri]MCT7568241.1 hypothetical protein [Aliarcobacter butzleri]